MLQIDRLGDGDKVNNLIVSVWSRIGLAWVGNECHLLLEGERVDCRQTNRALEMNVKFNLVVEEDTVQGLL